MKLLLTPCGLARKYEKRKDRDDSLKGEMKSREGWTRTVAALTTLSLLCSSRFGECRDPESDSIQNRIASRVFASYHITKGRIVMFVSEDALRLPVTFERKKDFISELDFGSLSVGFLRVFLFSTMERWNNIQLPSSATM